MDRFGNFAELSRHAAKDRDYVIEIRKGLSDVAVMAPHGGRIEPGTDAIADAVAGSVHSYYAFKGVRRRKNIELHISSRHFDEPRALTLARQVSTIVTLHGCRGTRPAVGVGGLAEELCGNLIHALRAAGLDAGKPSNPCLRGVHPHNLCNRGLSGKGVQLELSAPLRRRLLNDVFYAGPHSGDDNLFKVFVAAVRSALPSVDLVNSSDCRLVKSGKASCLFKVAADR